ncbi:MAG: hypothetical protein H6730_33850 [Deltaproteobacteria bacterium]|nr:hypothetical protein [Deltaproteobacteria bacterium]
MRFDPNALEDDTDAPTLPPVRAPARPFLWGTAGASALGAVFAAVSTRDFISHLDRQQHSIHCSLMPGGGASLGESGCRTVLMSPYSSVLRTELWGGVPISLLAFAVFAYLVYRSAATALEPRVTRRDAGYLWLATGLPAAMSVIYGLISTQALGAVCQVCLGIYISSTLAFVLAGLAFRGSEPTGGHASPWPMWGRWFAEGVVTVVALVGLYVAFAPKGAKDGQGCGVLAQTADPGHVLVPSPYSRGTSAVMVLDPLCPACRGFDKRLDASGLGARMDMKYVLFPLDASCNWMLTDSLHPGACAVSEAMLCDPNKAQQVLEWAFAHQEELLEGARKGDGPLRAELKMKFPHVQGCLGTNKVKAQLRKSLKWGVANAIPVLTPQLFVGERRMCDEDTDLGLEYTLTTMLNQVEGKR